jgi:hypothetical protein
LGWNGVRSAAKGRPSTGSIREHLDSLGWAPDEALLESLLTDPRAGVRSLGRRVLARRARLEAEKVRQRRMLRLESEQWGRCRRAGGASRGRRRGSPRSGGPPGRG